MQEIGSYVLGPTIGTGTTGKVRLAVHKDTNKQVAIKVVSKSQFADKPGVEAKIKREISLMHLIDHPYLIKLLEICESSRHLYIVLEYAEKGELFNFLMERRRIEPQDALSIFRELIYGLEYLHTHGICHRDLKPENLLLDKFLHLKIADFGFARWMRSNVAETSCGSPHYASPEVIRGVRYDGRLADVWSCGVILYAMLVGRLPFDDPSIRTLLAKVKNGVYQIPSHVPDVIQELLRGMLTVDVTKRFTITQVKEHAAFRLFLPESYKLPKPLPLTNLADQIDLINVSPPLIGILRSIGYESDEEIEAELKSDTPTMAKVFHRMYQKNANIEDLPWPNEVSQEEGSDLDEGFILPPQMISQTGVAKNPFHIMHFEAASSAPSQIGSLTVKTNWGNEPIPDLEAYSEHEFTEICISKELVLSELQQFCDRMGIDWFHPNDTEMLCRVTSCTETMFVRFVVSYEHESLITLKAMQIRGTTKDFKELMASVTDLIDVTIEENQSELM